jgi:hypothetical protein
MIAGGVSLVLSPRLLVLGLASTGLSLVYVSLACSVAGIPLVVIGAVRWLSLAARLKAGDDHARCLRL